MNDSLLPPNATPPEIALANSTSRIGHIPVALSTLWNPQTCPAELLPWLAWALSVDEWDSGWSLDVKRDLIAQSVRIHRAKGTVAAIKRVLQALGIEIDLAEWFTYGGEPHTFRLTAWANDNRVGDGEVILGAGLYQAVRRSVDSVKPVRSHYDFRVGAAFDTVLGLGATSTRASVIRTHLQPSAAVDLPSLNMSSPITVRIVAIVRATLHTGE